MDILSKALEIKQQKLATQELLDGIHRGDRIILSKAITLIESTRSEDQVQAGELLNAIIDKTGKSIRVGITGVPGVGKSTFIEAFGKLITSKGYKLAVLTIDPTSTRTKGSILGDKTRMEDLAKDPNAFIRPTASGGTLGGVASRTRESIMLCEASGFDFIIVETVGVGQSEVAVRNMVDFFLLLMLPGAGDELQGIKKGIMEMADGLVINKADGDNIKKANQAKAEYQQALHLFPPAESGWATPVLTCSSSNGTGIESVLDMTQQYTAQTKSSDYFERQRSSQAKSWLHEYFDQLLKNDFQKLPVLQKELERLERKVGSKEVSPYVAAQQLLRQYHQIIREG